MDGAAASGRVHGRLLPTIRDQLAAGTAENPETHQVEWYDRVRS